MENYATSGYSHIGGLLREDCERVRVGISLGFSSHSHLLRLCEGTNKNESDILGFFNKALNEVSQRHQIIN